MTVDVVGRRMQSWATAKGALVHAWMDSSWFTNMFEVTSADLPAGNLSFEDSGEYAGYPRGGGLPNLRLALPNGSVVEASWVSKPLTLLVSSEHGASINALHCLQVGRVGETGARGAAESWQAIRP
jgi:hypothetical protein